MTINYEEINHQIREKLVEGDKLKNITFNKINDYLDHLDDWIFDQNSSDRYELRHKKYDFKVYLFPGMFSSRSWVEVRSTSNRIYFNKEQSKIILHKVKLIKKKLEIDSMQFVSDVVMGVYVLYQYFISDEQRLWLKENASNKNAYKIVEKTVYIRDEELATAYKLAWF